ncbi:porin [Burkholderia ubonensis]|uniref:porin n=1 Tax=Burkholderia ubonensis TaxID=101571 RepID=UPI00075A25AB|nr:porin [Burkholderia ubonensis]KVD71088.1 porin [Burkholderia ubonensis]KVO83102.1 porin [Burkholderia ubonensis]KVP35497.1 porin [Burkholderia ubonensis]KVT86566.1 porin [Burkholderia ubonensis]KVX11318.1 porin [Burkholderia ubonensis]
MKNRLILSAVALGAAGPACHAYAQSTVTLYGVIDDAIQYTHNVAGKSTKLGLTSGVMSGSRWGLLGAEDLGGGFKAVFRLENGFNVNTGGLNQGGREFGRQAYVGVASSRWGTVTLGRQYDALRDLVQPVQGDNYLEYFTSPGDVDDADNSLRFNNTVKWASPVWSGLQAVATYSFGGVAGSVASGQSYSGALAYNAGPFGAAAGYMHIDNGNASLSTRGASSADSIFATSVNKAYASARAINILRAGAKYAVGPVTLGGYYSFSEYVADGSSSFKGSERYNNGSVYALWQVSVPLVAEVGYNYLKSSGHSSATYHQVTAAVDYALSKRTDLYASVGYGHASGSNGAGSAQAVIGPSDIDAGKRTQELALVGIRHRF